MTISSAVGASRDPVECLGDLLYTDECRRYIDAILIYHVDDPMPVNPDQFRKELRQILVRGVISRDEYQQVREIDIMAYDAAGGSAIAEYAVVEVSVTPNSGDIDKAVHLCALVRRATGIAARAFCIAASPWPEALAEYAAARNVTVIRRKSKYDETAE